MPLTARTKTPKNENRPELNVPADARPAAAAETAVTPADFTGAAKRPEILKELHEIRNRAVTDLATEMTRNSVREGEEIRTSIPDDEIDAAIDAANTSGIDISRPDRYMLRKEIRDEIFEFGPISDLLHDDTISEIMVNAPDMIFIERKGKLLEAENVRFDDDQHVRKIIDKIVAPLGRRIDESSPMVDARLPDGSRVNAVIPPVTLKGTALTIRKFSVKPLTMSDLIGFGTLSGEMSEFLKAAVEGRLNILISGGTGTGKTTLLNVLSGFIPSEERIITIEDAAELKLMQRHVVSMEARPESLNGTGAVTIRDMVRNALRMRPDRIIVGEVRGAECIDMLQAMNTGHDGSITTAHANTPRDALSRIETMAQMDKTINMESEGLKKQIESAFNLIVQQTRFKDGSRKITSISEVSGFTDGTISLQELFKYSPYKSNGDPRNPPFVACGIKPRCTGKIELNGGEVKNEWFSTTD